MKTHEPLQPGRRVLLEIGLPSGSAIEAIGRVAWTKRVLSPDGRDREAGIGIEFMGGVSGELAQLTAFIEGQDEV